MTTERNIMLAPIPPRQGVKLTWAQALSVDRICGEVHKQGLPYSYILESHKIGSDAVSLYVDGEHYVIGIGGGGVYE